MNQQRGFSLVELLTVIAIMALLMSIIVPAFNTARENANKSADIADMNTIRSALQQYYADHERYPPALMGYITQYDKTGVLKDVIPADKLKNTLYPRRIASPEVFRPVFNQIQKNKPLGWITAARYPKKDPSRIGTRPILDLNGDGKIDSKDDTAGARQAFGPKDGFVVVGESKVTSLPQTANDPRAAKFYKLSGYDVAEVPIPDSGFKDKKRFELRYTLFWTQYALQKGGSAQDDPRQLGYSDPPENTLVTWNSYFRSWNRDKDPAKWTPTSERKDVVLFLGGAAKSFKSDQIHKYSWRVLPKDG